MILFAVLFVIFNVCNSAKILVYCPSISKSHVLLCSKYADTLTSAGHDVVFFIPSYLSVLDNYDAGSISKVERLTNISNKFDEALSVEEWKSVLESPNLGVIKKLYFDTICWLPQCEALIQQIDRINYLRDYKFDLAIVEDVDYCNFGIVNYIGPKSIVLLSSEPLLDHVSYLFGLPAPPSYVPSLEENALTDRMTFFERAHNVYKHFTALAVHYIMTELLQKAFRKHLGADYPHVRDIARNASLVFVNTNEFLDLQRPISHKVIFVGMLGRNNTEDTLDENWDQVLSKGKLGSVLVSFGTVGPFHLMPMTMQTAIRDTIVRMPDYHFVLKTTPGDDTTEKMFENVTNVDLRDWIPQVSVLKHSHVKLFVSHGGMNSVLEAMSCGKPMIVVPVFTDQFRNGKGVERKGAGLMIEREDVTTNTFSEAVKQVLSDKRYSETAKRLSNLMNKRPFSPEERLVKWINFVLDNHPFHNFDIQAANLSLIQYFHIDVIVFLVLSAFASWFIYQNITVKQKLSK